MSKIYEIILYWTIPSKKNSKQIVCKPFPKLLSSPAYNKWEKEQLEVVSDFIKKNGSLKNKSNLVMNVHFKVWLLKTKKPSMRAWDLSNKLESIQDMLVKAWFIDDDNRFVISEVIASWSDSETQDDYSIIKFYEKDSR